MNNHNLDRCNKDYNKIWSHLYTPHSSVQSLSRVRLCDPMDCSTPGLPVHHQLPELTQTQVHWVGDAIQPAHPLSSPSPPTFNLFQHATKFGSVSQSCLSLCNLMNFSMPGYLVPLPTPKTCSNSHPSSQWCHPTISSSVVPFSSCLQSFSASGSFPVRQFFT